MSLDPDSWVFEMNDIFGILADRFFVARMREIYKDFVRDRTTFDDAMARRGMDRRRTAYYVGTIRAMVDLYRSTRPWKPVRAGSKEQANDVCRFVRSCLGLFGISLSHETIRDHVKKIIEEMPSD